MRIQPVMPRFAAAPFTGKALLDRLRAEAKAEQEQQNAMLGPVRASVLGTNYLTKDGIALNGYTLLALVGAMAQEANNSDVSYDALRQLFPDSKEQAAVLKGLKALDDAAQLVDLISKYDRISRVRLLEAGQKSITEPHRGHGPEAGLKAGQNTLTRLRTALAAEKARQEAALAPVRERVLNTVYFTKDEAAVTGRTVLELVGALIAERDGKTVYDKDIYKEQLFKLFTGRNEHQALEKALEALEEEAQLIDLIRKYSNVSRITLLDAGKKALESQS